MKYKYFTLLILAAFLFTSTFSQPTITKQKDIGGKNDDRFTCMDVTKDGGLVAGGYSISRASGQKTDTGKGRYDYWVVKLDSLQNIQWDKTIGGEGDDILKSIQQTTDGGYILGGYSDSKISGDKTQKNNGYTDYWVVKLDSLGNVQWDKTIGGKAYDYLISLQQTNDGGYILGGRSQSGISGDKTDSNRGFDDYWVVKLDATGSIEWDKTIGGSDGDILRSVQQTSDGGYIIGGYSRSHRSGDKTQASRGGTDYWIVKLNSDGKIKWDKTIGGSKDDVFSAIQQTPDGGYILAGYSESDISGNKTEISRGRKDYWILKVNSNGDVLWDKTIGSNKDDQLYSIQQTKDGGFILGGYSRSNISGDKTENNEGKEDYWIVKLNKKRVIEWDKTIAASNKIISLNTIAANKNFSAYPNPAKDILYVQSKTKTIYSLTDQSGKTILTKTINGNGEINVADFTPGIYYLKNNETGISQKIVVTR